jgi:hypothetical protein
MFEELSPFQVISVVAWILVIVYFTPKIYRTWKGRREDWLEAAWMVGAAVMVASILLRPEWSANLSSLLVVALVSLTLLERRSRKN